ncbi:ferric-siderophore receptor [Bordetella ansorpii]|uniref:Ferric-siderophore receptor n=1 Tax=Bordetella ansorpii TaxID=288768 RepID=A0A157SB82_9BORD|nr:ferric-siderophore receptor [Bordetella ansorpii]
MQRKGKVALQSKQITGPRATRLAVAAALALSAAGYASGAVAQQASAAQQAQARSYAIAAGPLSDALSAFAGQAGITLSFRPEQTDGRASPGLRGSFTVEEGLAQLLQGSGLRAVPHTDNGYVLQGNVPATAPAVPVGTSSGPATLEAIQVSGSWLGTGLQNSVRSFGGARTLVQFNEIEQSGATNVSDVLRRVPGVQINGSTSAAGSSVGLHVGVRGLSGRNSSRSTMLIDGIPLAMAPYGQPNLVMAPVSLANIESIDVVRGGGAVRYGPQNVGGIINFKTRAIPAEPGLTGDATLRYNLFGEGGGNAQYSTFIGSQLDNGFGLAVLYSGMDGKQWRDGSDDTYNDLALKWRHEVTPTSEVYGKFSYYDVKSMTPGGLTQAEYRDDPFQNTRPTDYWKGERKGLDVGYLNTISDTQEFEVRAYHYNSSRESSLINVAAGRNDFQPRSNQVTGIEPRYTQRFEAGPTTHDVTVGYRFIRETGEDKRYNTLLSNGRASAATVFVNGTRAHSVYIDDRIAYGDWRVTPGVRYERIDSDRHQQGTSDEPFEQRNRKALPSLNIAYLVNPNLTLYTNYNTSFGAVQYTQLNSMSATNPLRPEIAKTVEAGTRWSGKQMRAEFTVFNLRFDNQILSIPGTNPAVFRNLGATQHNGVEFAWDYDFDRAGPLAGFNVYANYTYTRAIQKSGEDQGKEVPFNSRQTGTLGARYAVRAWTFDLSTTMQSGHYTDAANTEEESANAMVGRVPGFSVWNFQAGWQIPNAPGSSIVAGVNNLLDRRYYTRNTDSDGGRMVGAPRMFYLQTRLAF